MDMDDKYFIVGHLWLVGSILYGKGSYMQLFMMLFGAINIFLSFVI